MTQAGFYSYIVYVENLALMIWCHGNCLDSCVLLCGPEPIHNCVLMDTRKTTLLPFPSYCIQRLPTMSCIPHWCIHQHHKLSQVDDELVHLGMQYSPMLWDQWSSMLLKGSQNSGGCLKWLPLAATREQSLLTWFLMQLENGRNLDVSRLHLRHSPGVYSDRRTDRVWTFWSLHSMHSTLAWAVRSYRNGRRCVPLQCA